MDNATCSVDGCTRPLRIIKRRLCNTHYQADLRAKGKGRTKYVVECDGCGKEFDSTRPDGKLCSDECRALVYADGSTSPLPHDHPVMVFVNCASTPIPADHPVVLLGTIEDRMALSRAVSLGAWRRVIDVIQLRSRPTIAGCWEWQGRIGGKGDYPQVRVGGREVFVHRLAIEAKHEGRPLGKQAAHHICANTRCVNPDHLQPVTARENTAEMLARTYMTRRIADLEAALSIHDPGHPLLREIGMAEAS